MKQRYSENNPFSQDIDDDDVETDFPIESLKKGDFSVIKEG